MVCVWWYTFSLELLDRPKPPPLLSYSTPDDFTLSNARRFYSSVMGEPLGVGGKGLTGPICPSLFLLNPFPPKPAKTGPFIILLCLTPDDFTHQGRTLKTYMYIHDNYITEYVMTRSY